MKTISLSLLNIRYSLPLQRTCIYIISFLFHHILRRMAQRPITGYKELDTRKIYGFCPLFEDTLSFIKKSGASLVAQWLRICLPMQGSSPGLGRSHMPRSNWAREPQLLSLRSKAHEPQLLSPRATTTEARVPRARAPQQEKPLQ